MLEKVTFKKVYSGEHQVYFNGDRFGRLWLQDKQWVLVTTFGFESFYKSFSEARRVIARDEDLQSKMVQRRVLITGAAEYTMPVSLAPILL